MRDPGRGERRAWLLGAIALCGLMAPITAVTAALAAPGLACQPGSGPHLAGRHFTQAQIASYTPDHLQCADLSGADLSGLSLIQINFTGASLRGANLQHADLTQATLDGADLSGANLSAATLDQVSAHGTSFAGANLSNASLVQADLTGANLNLTNLSGATFTEADLGQATFHGATGLTPWSKYLLIAAAALFVLLALQTIRRRGRRRSGLAGLAGVRGRAAAGGWTAADGVPGYGGAPGFGGPPGFGGQPGFGGTPATGFGGIADMPGVPVMPSVSGAQVRAARPFWLLRGLIGALLVALGFHLFAGGLLGQFVGGFGAPLVQTCSGPQCAVGVASGFLGIFGGIAMFLVGLGIRASA